MKSSIAPNTSVFQLEVRDYKHRQPPPHDGFYVDKSGRGIREKFDTIPIITLFRRAKTAEQAKRSASKKGSVISCRKVDSHLRRLDMISHLRIEQKPIDVEVRLEEFTIGRDLEIESTTQQQKIIVDRGLDK